MLAIQPRLPHALAPARSRRVRRPFYPAAEEGNYRLPKAVRERLIVSLAQYRNREAAFALAVFLARFWSMPARVGGSFPIDRRALAGHDGHELTEARVRGAIRALEEVGYLDRSLAAGSPYKPTAEGLRRKPILFVFGPEYGSAFVAANNAAAAARGRLAPRESGQSADRGQSRSLRSLSMFPAKSPKSRIQTEKPVLMGETRKEIGFPPQAFASDTKLEAALDRLKEAIGFAGAGEGRAEASQESGLASGDSIPR